MRDHELAMERLNKSAPLTKLNDAQKKEIAELESKAKAKTAEREIALKDAIAAASEAGDFEKITGAGGTVSGSEGTAPVPGSTEAVRAEAQRRTVAETLREDSKKK